MKVLAVTTNASLVVALGSMMREWEVVTVRNAEAAVEHGPDAAVALIDLGGTEEGVEALNRLHGGGVSIPAVVIGDVPSTTARASILVRPFSLEDLSAAVRDAAEGRGRAPATAPEEVAAPSPGVAETPKREPPPRREEAQREEIAALAGAPAPAKPPRFPGANDRRGPLSLVPPRQPEAPAEPGPTAEPEATAPAEPSDDALAPPRATSTAPVEAPTTAEPEPEEETAAEATAEEEAAEVAPPPEPPAAPAAPTLAPTAPQRRQEEAHEAPEAPGRRGRLRLRGQRQPLEEPPAKTSVVGRLQAGAAHAHEIEELLDEMPFLADLVIVADGLAGEVEAQLSVQIVSVFVRSEEGFQSIANRGLSKVEAGMIVPETQPLLSDVLRTGEGFLIQPVDLAQGLVSGIGGARTEAIMAAPCVVRGRCNGIVVAGGEGFDEEDLDRLTELATEAAPGLAVAQLIERLRSH